MHTFLTPPRYADSVSRLPASTEPAPSLPGRLCVVGALAGQWRLVELSDTKNDRVELVAFSVGAAKRQQERSFAALHFVQHGGKSCAPIVVNDDGFDDNRRSRTILVHASAAALACAELREFRHQLGTRSVSDCLFFEVLQLVLRSGATRPLARLCANWHHQRRSARLSGSIPQPETRRFGGGVQGRRAIGFHSGSCSIHAESRSSQTLGRCMQLS